MRPKHSVPNQFAAIAPSLYIREARERWNVSYEVVARWEAVTGVKCKREKPEFPRLMKEARDRVGAPRKPTPPNNSVLLEANIDPALLRTALRAFDVARSL